MQSMAERVAGPDGTAQVEAAEIRQGVAIVLSGGGARGAYEAGALSVLLPALEAAGQRPTIFIGTSTGAINATAFASLQHLPAVEACGITLNLWRQITPRDVFRLSLPKRPGSLLNSSPLVESLAQRINWDRLHENIATGRVRALGIVATTWTSMRTTVFVEGAPDTKCPENDEVRAIDYVPISRLDPQHVRASSAIPVVFPPVFITAPAPSADWYIDGGIRLNTPIKPALELRAARVIVIATAPEFAAEADATTPQRPPGIASAAARLFSTLLDDRMLEDLRNLARRNVGATPVGKAGDDRVPYLFVGPPPGEADLFARLVGDILEGHTASSHVHGKRLRQLVRRAMGKLTARDHGAREIMSHLFFNRDFADGAIRLGQRDARRTLADDGTLAWRNGLPSGGSIRLP